VEIKIPYTMAINSLSYEITEDSNQHLCTTTFRFKSTRLTNQQMMELEELCYEFTCDGYGLYLKRDNVYSLSTMRKLRQFGLLAIDKVKY